MGLEKQEQGKVNPGMVVWFGKARGKRWCGAKDDRNLPTSVTLDPEARTSSPDTSLTEPQIHLCSSTESHCDWEMGLQLLVTHGMCPWEK